MTVSPQIANARGRKREPKKRLRDTRQIERSRRHMRLLEGSQFDVLQQSPTPYALFSAHGSPTSTARDSSAFVDS